jgi:DNA-binding transcriptional ArsR family regulator
MKQEELARLHKALSIPVRLKILELIAGRPRCVNAITHSLTISQPAVSQHLAVLRRAGLVTGEKQGYMVHYAINRERLGELRRAMDEFPKEEIPSAARMEGETSSGGGPGEGGRHV